MNNENQPPSLPAVPDTKEEEKQWSHDFRYWRVLGLSIHQPDCKCGKCVLPLRNTVQGQMYRSLRSANVARQAEWCPEQVPDLSFRGNELAGETGEVCNVIKKLERERQGWRGSRDTKEHLAEELADVVICADLIGIAAGIDLDAAVALKFNATSEKVGLPHRLTPSVGAETKSDAASEFSQIPFETGGRNALEQDGCGAFIPAKKSALQSAQAASDGKEQETPTQKPLSVILDEIEERANLAAKVFYAGNVTNAKSAMDVPALVKALRRAMRLAECLYPTQNTCLADMTAILNRSETNKQKRKNK